MAACICRNRHYKIVEIHPRHWRALAQKVGGAELWRRMQELAKAVDPVVDRISARLPRGFPDVVISRVADGMRGQAHKFLAAATTS